MEHKARPPARFSSLLRALGKSPEQKTKTKKKNHLHKIIYKTKTTFPLNKPLGRYGLYNHCSPIAA
jgi:hypothetical protein